MKRLTRGSTVTFELSAFLDHTGASVVPSSVAFRVDYPASSRSRTQLTVAGVNTSGDIWAADWDSSVAFPGTVFVSALANATNDIVDDDQFQLTANQANPDPS